jgi:hypothetical protein
MLKPLLVLLDELLLDLHKHNEIGKAIAAVTAIVIICASVLLIVPLR